MYKYCEWNKGDEISKNNYKPLLMKYENVLKLNMKKPKTYHKLSEIFIYIINHREELKLSEDEYIENKIKALDSLFTCIKYSSKDDSITYYQDLLQILKIWFHLDKEEKICDLIKNQINTINIEIWFTVIPQLFARLDSLDENSYDVLLHLLKLISISNPSILIYPLNLSLHNIYTKNIDRAKKIQNYISNYNPNLFEESQQFCNELSRIALLLIEIVYFYIQKSWQHFKKDEFIESGLLLREMFSKIPQNHESESENIFLDSFLPDLRSAEEYLDCYIEKDEIEYLENCFYIINSNIYPKIEKEVKQMHYLDLSYISPVLSNIKDSNIPFPLNYLDKLTNVNTSVTIVKDKVYKNQVRYNKIKAKT